MLVYIPSKDCGFGHASRPRSLNKFIPQVTSFLERFTIHSGPRDVSIQVFRASDFDSEDHSERYKKAVISCFGPCSNDGGFFLGTLGSTPKPMNYRWNLPGDLLGKAIDFLLSGHPYPKQLFGPVQLSYSFDFEWKDPRSGLPFAEETKDRVSKHNTKSSIRIDLQRESFVAPELQFPFSVSDERLYDMLKLIVPALPFKIGVKHFRLRLPLKNGPGDKLARLDSTKAARISECL
jgi:hypothetical protein